MILVRLLSDSRATPDRRADFHQSTYVLSVTTPPPAGADEAGHQAINTKKIVSPVVLVSVPVPYHCEESSAIATWNFYLWQWGHALVCMTCMYLAA